MFNDTYPLNRHCLLNSGNAAEVKDQVSQHLWSHRMCVAQGKPLQSRLYGVFFGNAALFDLHYGAEVEIDAGDIASYYLIRITLQGSGLVTLGKRSAAMQAGSLTISSPSEPSIISIGRDCRNLILRVERQALEHQLQRLLDRPIKHALVFDLAVGPDSPGLAAVRETLDYLCRLYQHPAIDGVTQTLAAGFSDYLLALLLTQLPHNYSDALRADHRQPLPQHVRRARDYIESHVDEAISLADLAAHCGVSVRTLQNGFTQFLKQSPSDYVRNQRLTLVHAALEQARAGDSVTDILLRHGVTSFGHFATHYRKRYGCLPSDTLRQNRRMGEAREVIQKKWNGDRA
ncbi:MULTISPECIES: AraC family transcriptional regulator [Achromobacter]|uniref:AraC family transcriptional regulator n=1 Tax=Achromobacter spanius TaxID=217203 RepID=A0ABY8GZE1_9BURK|nr:MULTISPECIES: AraC family transcriptional regulator [Achromobacter]WAI86104.1 AraC family transcriptional regulator [Achromobacter spanius]WEX96185.1 AraC family transcriptional regulator [Achromobacter sp. SS2-2022]WFP10097.1 AraC family transcriptional regulator [Achromobacter spanius]